jgi:hypothetical protein
MGERQSDGGPAGRRRVHPEGAPPSHGGAGSVLGRRAVDTADLEALLAAALIRHDVDADAEQRAVAAFVQAREAGAHRARSRRGDDWRVRRGRLGRHSLRATLSAVFAGLTLSGVAVAGIGVVGSSSDGPAEDDRPTHVPADGTTPSAGQSAGQSAGPGRLPGAADATEAHCRAYEQAEGRGEAMEATAWQWLVQEAGGAAKVDAYCAERLGTATAEPSPENTGTPPSESAGEPGRPEGGPTGGAGGSVSAGAGGASAGASAGVSGGVGGVSGSASAGAGGASAGSGGASAGAGGSAAGAVADAGVTAGKQGARNP